MEIIVAVIALLGAIALGIVSGILTSIGLGSFFSAIAGFGSGALVVTAIVLLLSAYGLWKGTMWGWWLAMIVAVLTIIFTFFTIIGIAVGLVILYYLTRPGVRKWFRV